MLIGELSADTMSSSQEFVLPKNKPDSVFKKIIIACFDKFQDLRFFFVTKKLTRQASLFAGLLPLALELQNACLILFLHNFDFFCASFMSRDCARIRISSKEVICVKSLSGKTFRLLSSSFLKKVCISPLLVFYQYHKGTYLRSLNSTVVVTDTITKPLHPIAGVQQLHLIPAATRF